jgi:hypothetical protein
LPAQRRTEGPSVGSLDSGGGFDQRRRGVVVGMSGAVRAARAAGLGAGAERLVENLPDGAGTAAAFRAAAEASIDLACRARRRSVRGRYDGADVMVAKNIAGTNDHGITANSR